MIHVKHRSDFASGTRVCEVSEHVFSLSTSWYSDQVLEPSNSI